MQRKPSLFFGKLKSGSNISILGNGNFLAFEPCIFVPGFENVSAGWKIGNGKRSVVIGYAKVRMIEDMDIRQHPRVCIADDFEDSGLSNSGCDIYRGTPERQR